MGTFEVNGGKGGPILICIGGLGVEIASRLVGVPSSDLLILDTDRRSKERIETDNVRIVGGDLVGGEGCGGNLNMARACFRKEMEDIATVFLSRSPVILLSSSGGATGLAGSAEIGGLLIRTDRPSFSVLMRGSMEQSITDTTHITKVMLDGPLRPGCLVSLGSGDEGHDTSEVVWTEDKLISFLGALLAVFSGDAPLPMDISALQALRKEGGVHYVQHFIADDLDKVPPLHPIRAGTVLVLIGVGRGTTVERMRKLTAALMGGRADTHIGFYPVEDAVSSVRGFIIRKEEGNPSEQAEPLTTLMTESGLGPADPVLGSSQLVEGGFAPIHR
ncbi:MAG: hypothetical protein MUC62_02580 [Candidatus Thermoplasmatota archaeon]|jgi:hypothetical protein|nr:hypothetical protein [Candidatus Thermoplasmatota archaeon]